MKIGFNRKVLYVILFFILALLFMKTEVKAAHATISCSDSVEVNSPITINVTGSGVQWALRLIVDGKVIASSYETKNLEKNININFSGTYTPTTVGAKTIKLEGSVTEYADESSVVEFGSKTITVKDKSNNNGSNNNNNNNPDNNNNSGNTGNNSGTSNEGNEDDIPQENTPVTTTKSQDNSLKSLSVNVGTLSPKFSSRTTKYTVDVGQEVTSIKISATKNHSKAKLSGTGTKELRPGANTFDITVEAENGSTQTYTITVNKPEEKKEMVLKLSKLEIKGINTNREILDLKFDPEFSEDVYSYKIDVEEDIESLSVEAIPKEEGTIVEIIGNENLVYGENIVNIVVKSAEGEQTATYQIIVNKKEPVEQVSAVVEEMPQETQKNKSVLSAYTIPIAVFAVVVVVLGTAFATIEYKHYKKSNTKEEKEFNKNTKEDSNGISIDSVNQDLINTEDNIDENFMNIEEIIGETVEISKEDNIEIQNTEESNIETMDTVKEQTKERIKKRGKGKHF